MIKNIKFQKILTALVILSLFSYIASQLNIALYLLFFLAPIVIIKVFNEHKQYLINLTLDLTIWLIFNSLILKKDFITLAGDNIPVEISVINALLVAWINCYLYISFFINVYRFNDGAKYYKFITDKFIMLATIVFSVLTSVLWWKKYSLSLIASPHVIYIFLAVIIFDILYVFLMSHSFSRRFCLYTNFLFSLAPLMTMFFAFVSVIVILQTFLVSEKFKSIYLYHFDFLSIFQATSLGALYFYFFNKKINKFHIMGKVMLFVLISVGLTVQYLLYGFHW